MAHAIVLDTLGVDVVRAAEVKVPKEVVVVLTLQLMAVATVALTVTAEEVAATVDSGETICNNKLPNEPKTISAKTKPIADQNTYPSFLLSRSKSK